MARHNATSIHGPKQHHLRWVLILGLLAVVSAVALLEARRYHATVRALREQTLWRLRSLHILTERLVHEHFRRLHDEVVSLGRDPSAETALAQFADATRDLETDVVTEPGRMHSHMVRLKRFLEDYYRTELAEKSLDLPSLLLPQRSAVWLQATYTARSPATQANSTTGEDTTLYAKYQAAWDAHFQAATARLGVEDLYLIDGASGRVVYSVRKQPDFQTSVLGGPYATSSLAALFRNLQAAGPDDGYRIVDFAPYVPAHGKPSAFAGVPILDGARPVGALIVRLSSESLTRLLSAEGQWSQIGLGDTGDLYVVGAMADDLRMRTESRFGPHIEGEAAAGGIGNATTVLRQRITFPPSLLRSGAGEYEGEFINYRGIPVLGTIGPMNDLDGLSWALVAEISGTEALAPLAPLEIRGLVLPAAVLLGIFLIALAILGRPHTSTGTSIATSAGEAIDVQQPPEDALAPIVSAVLAAADGDLSQRVSGNGQWLGNLPHSLNRMWRTIGTFVGHVHRTCKAAIDTTMQLQATAHALSNAAAQQLSELSAGGARLHAAGTGLDAVALEERTVEMAASADAALAASDQAVADVATDVDALRQQARGLTMRMKRIGERSMEISTLAAVVQDVGAQALVVALNASIEAARAGKDGLGFKGVANDVRKLAERSEAAARDIAEQVATLHSEATDTAEAIDQQTDVLEHQGTAALNARVGLARCRDLVRENGKRLAGILATVREPAHVAAPEDVRQGFAEFAGRTHVLAEQAAHSSAALLSMLSELKVWAGTFRIGSFRRRPPARTQVIELGAQDVVGGERSASA